jgi:uncharacterized protein
MLHTTHLLYLHGFRSSPQSAKATQMAERVRRGHPGVRWWCPQLPPSPRDAMAGMMAGIAGWPHRQMAVVGSSLGGFYAAWVAARTGCRYVVLNPAVFPARDLARHIGAQTSWHAPQERFFFQPAYVDELRELESAPPPDPTQGMAVIAQGDELLDWREMQACHAGTRLRLIEGSDHALSDFDRHIDAVLAFLDLA